VPLYVGINIQKVKLIPYDAHCIGYHRELRYRQTSVQTMWVVPRISDRFTSPAP